jgi:hypothetical protein
MSVLGELLGLLRSLVGEADEARHGQPDSKQAERSPDDRGDRTRNDGSTPAPGNGTTDEPATTPASGTRAQSQSQPQRERADSPRAEAYVDASDLLDEKGHADEPSAVGGDPDGAVGDVNHDGVGADDGHSPGEVNEPDDSTVEPDGASAGHAGTAATDDDSGVAPESIDPDPDPGDDGSVDNENGVDAPPTLDLDAAFDVDDEFDWVDDPVAAGSEESGDQPGADATGEADPAGAFDVVTGFDGDQHTETTAVTPDVGSGPDAGAVDEPTGGDASSGVPAPSEAPGPGSPTADRPTASSGPDPSVADGWELAGELDPDNVTRVRASVPEPSLPDERGEPPAIDGPDPETAAGTDPGGSGNVASGPASGSGSGLDPGSGLSPDDPPAGLDPDNVSRSHADDTDEAVERLSEFVYGGGRSRTTRDDDA